MAQLDSLYELSRQPLETAAWHLSWRKRGETMSLRITTPAEAAGVALSGGMWMVPRFEACADEPGKYHPLYAAAMLESAAFEADGKPHTWRVPSVAFTTDEWTRRSMTLNGMRMSTEFYASGSERVLELLRNRLEKEQRDVVHDVLVYQFRRVVDVRLEAREVRLLRGESVAAYLGLQREGVEALFLQPRLYAAEIAARLQNGEAGEIRRKLDVESLLAGQLRLLKAELAKLAARERTALHLLQQSAALLEAR